MRTLLAAPLALLLAFSGCMKVHEDLVVFPDGSGKLILGISVKPAKDDPDKSLEEDIMAGDPDEMEKQMPGIVALTRPKVERKDGWIRIQLTAYFEDLNKVRFKKDAAQDFAQEFSFRPEGDGFLLEIKGNMIADKSADRPEDAESPAELKKQLEEMFRKMFEGFEFRQSARLPGKVTKVEGFQSSEERIALYKVADKDLQKPEDQKKINKVTLFRASCGRSEVSDVEAADFRKELAQAKADWVELRKEMKKNSEKKRK